ncbi:MAG: TonB-dependent receptor [Gammaproteobacteria bacterium]|nr:TonB-dependent receptor [Gammaproteobacteria bacterium]MYD81132.1 TonB-dependent receptor [Gammaproteobacteria bacterium]
MRLLSRRTRVLAYLFTALWLVPSDASQHGSDSEEESDLDNDEIEEVIVVSDPRSLIQRTLHGSSSSVDAETISLVSASHPNEIFSRFPGVWVVRGSGQEHLTGIRSAVLAGAGACGAFLFLEDNVPVRPVGFCNVNGLFELNTEQADEIEVLRGPASPLFGGNALHGVINVRSFLDGDAISHLGMEGGPYDYWKIQTDYQQAGFRVKFLSKSTNGYRDATGFSQQKFNGQSRYELGTWDVAHALSLTLLNQETGGYVRGFKSYEQSDLRRSNPNPEAFRDARSLRVTSHWTTTTDFGDLYVSPYMRRSMMKFRQHFLPGQPFEKNSQTSFGAVMHWSRELEPVSLTVGVQLERMNAQLLQVQENETRGSAFLAATRPKGIHYNYDVTSSSGALFHSLTYTPNSSGEFSQSMRVELVNYDYTNRHLVGNTKDDGSQCGFGGCLYSRPANRTDDFANVATRIGYRHLVADQTSVWGLVGWGYRPPQTTELYRLQSGQSVADLDSEKLRSLEVGIQFQGHPFNMSVSMYNETNRDLIFRDAEGLNVSDGKIESQGAEFDLSWALTEKNELGLIASVASHKYAFARNLSRGERIVDGADVDSAPSLIANARWRYRPSRSALFEMEVNRVGSHYIDAANSARYGGHILVNARFDWTWSSRWRTSMKLINALDAAYADRADYAFGSYRYFPGHPRQVFVGIVYSLPSHGS